MVMGGVDDDWGFMMVNDGLKLEVDLPGVVKEWLRMTVEWLYGELWLLK